MTLSPSENDGWYYVDKETNAQTGPVTVQMLGKLFLSREVGESTYMWREGKAGWEFLSTLPDLFEAVKTSCNIPALPPVPIAAPNQNSDQFDSNSDKFGSNHSYSSSSGRGATRRLSGRVLNCLSKSANWKEKRTADDTPYYWNASTETVSWDKPECLMSEDERESVSGDWVWVKVDDGTYTPARIMKDGSDTVQVQFGNGSKKTVRRSLEPLWPLRQSSLKHIEDDLVMADDINIGLMVHCLRERFRSNKIYTWVGANHSVLVSINPFKQLPIYGPATIADFSRPSAYRLDPPHTYAIASSAYRRLCIEQHGQAILISGESGAGKTEATKQCFNFLADVAGSSNNLEQRILYANPVLEAFGNAKTLRNNNSSRFGRWTEVIFDTHNQICGARTENYLLEKQRVVNQARGERNFHIFYELCVSDIGQMLQLGPPESFRYLNSSGCTSVPGMNDRDDFDEVENAFNQLGFNLKEKGWLYGMCAGVLHLGNVSFSAQGEGSYVDEQGQGALQAAARLLQVDSDTLAQALTTRTIAVRGDSTHALNTVESAYQAADALAKAVYDHMFDWLVGRINVAVAGQVTNVFIGVLDIFGFEIFEKNYFEQLCINYTNEKLQQHFNRHTFKEEESVYESECIKYKHIHFIDNQPVVDLIEKKPYGLMPLLDEEAVIPRGSDQGWLGKCKSRQSSHPNLASASQNPNQFVVKHYAGGVVYDCAGFVVTNKDNLFRDLYDLMSGGSSRVTRALFPPMDKNPRRATTLGDKFRRALIDLMGLVDQCEPWYIRCIKPNGNKSPITFESNMCTEQLTCAGVFEAVAIRKNGYPFRLIHKHFANRYRCLAYKETGWVKLGSTHSDKEMCRALMGCVHQDFSRVQIGKTMVLYRAEEHRVLELLRNLCLERVLPVAQRMARKKLGRKFRRYMFKARDICRRALQAGGKGDKDTLRRTIEEAEAMTAPVQSCFEWEPYEMRHCRDLLFALEERAELYDVLHRLLPLDPLSCYKELRSAVQRCNKIRHIPGTPEQTALEAQARARLHEASAAKIEPMAEEALEILEKRLMQEISSEAEAVEYTSPSISEIRHKLALPEREFVQLQLDVARKLNDPERAINREIKLKEMFLDANEGLFTLPQQPGLHSAEEWASLKPLRTFAFGKKSKEELASTFLVHTTEPIHKSLMDIHGLKGVAVKQFKNLLGYCGDRKYQYPDTLLREIAAAGIEGGDDLRGELYVQLMKQLTKNPGTESRQRYWEVFKLLLHCFPPPEGVQNTVHCFVRANAPEDTKEKLKMAVHMSRYDGVKSAPPSDGDIHSILQTFFDREIAPRYNIEEDIVHVKPVRQQRAGWNAAYVSTEAPPPPRPQRSDLYSTNPNDIVMDNSSDSMVAQLSKALPPLPPRPGGVPPLPPVEPMAKVRIFRKRLLPFLIMIWELSKHTRTHFFIILSI